MFSSSSLSTFNNNVSPSRFYVDNMMGGYLVEDNLNPPIYHPSYYHLPSPLIYNEIDIFDDPFSHHELAIIQQSLRPNSSIATEDSSTFEVTMVMDSNKLGDQETVNGIVEDGNQNNEVVTTRPGGALKRRRTSKRDRHSKIRTAHGLRDRRMRLSLEVASPFFKLQDLLGYDKASSTVEWLLIQSNQAIEELYRSKNIVCPSEVTKCSMSNSTSNCEVESTTINVDQEKGANNSKGRRASTIAKEKKPKEKRKETTKESRNEARARARERTLERMQTRETLQGPFNMMEGCNESNPLSNKANNSIETREVINHGSLTTEDWSPLTTFNYHQSSEISQIVPSYKMISMQQDMIMGVPR